MGHVMVEGHWQCEECGTACVSDSCACCLAPRAAEKQPAIVVVEITDLDSGTAGDSTGAPLA